MMPKYIQFAFARAWRTCAVAALAAGLLTGCTYAPPSSDGSTSTNDGSTHDEPIVRYVLNEAGDGQEPQMVLDSAPDPLHMTLEYGSTDNLSYAEASTGRGLRWVVEGSSGTAFAYIDGTKVSQAMEGNSRATIEVVMELSAVTPDASRIFHIGRGAQPGRLSLQSFATNRIQFKWQDNIVAGNWPLHFANTGRCVLHVVLDTTLDDDDSRIRLFVNGTLVQENSGVIPAINQRILLGTDQSLYLGNRDEFMRSFAGSLYFAALYDRPLSEMEITSHADDLLINDDE